MPSESLRHFRDVCVVPAPHDAVATWYGHMEWVVANVSQDAIFDLNLEFWEELGPICQAYDDAQGAWLVDVIGTACDIVWYAMTEETRARFETLILERVKAEDAQSSVATLGSGGNSTR